MKISDKIALVTKTYANDIPRYRDLFESIQKYNEDNIPVYIIIPFQDKKLLQDTIGTEGYSLLFGLKT